MDSEKKTEEVQSTEQAAPASAVEMAKKDKQKKRKNRTIATIITVILLLLALLGLYLSGALDRPISGLTHGSIDWDQPENLQEEINKAVEEGMVNIFMNTNLYMKNSKAEPNLMIQNTETNPGPIQVTLKVIETEEVLYESEVIPVGYKVETAPLNREVEPGTYPCVAVFSIYDTKGKEVINQMNLNVTLSVDEK